MSAAGQSILDYLKRPVARANINLQEIATIPVLVPSKERQSSLVMELNAARESRNKKREEAAWLIERIDAYVTTALGLESVEVKPPMCFAVRLDQLQGTRIDVPYHQPLGIMSGTLKHGCSSLEDLAEIGANSGPPGAGDDQLVPYVGLPECDETSVREVVMRPYKEVRGRGIVKLGDILFARIEPSVFNRKYVLVETLLGHEYAYTSTEFYVVKALPDRIEQLYLYAMFFSPFLQAQIRGKTTGSSGRRRIDGPLFRRLQIPVPPLDLQKQIAEELVRRRREASRLDSEAEEEWQAAKRRFEAELFITA